MRYKLLHLFTSGMAFLGFFFQMHAQNATAGADPVGNFSGELTVSDMGAAVYNITFDVPNGGPLTPQIGLAYNSQKSGYGLAGYGFDITGISCITRGGKDMFHNGELKGVTFTEMDNYYLDGKRLVLVSGKEGQDGAKYCLEGDPYTVVTMHLVVKKEVVIDPSLLPDDPGDYDVEPDYIDIYSHWFEVKTNTGITFQYGRTSNSQLVVNQDKYSSPQVISWYVNRQEDRYKNYVTYDYDMSKMVAKPTIITYGMNSENDRGLRNVIKFEYQRLGENSRSFHISSYQGVQDVCLASISSLSNNRLYRKYKFEYNSLLDQTPRKWTRLAKVYVSNGLGEKLRPISFQWNSVSQDDVTKSSIQVNTRCRRSDLVETNTCFFGVDMNGDGIDDIIRVSNVTLTDVYGNAVGTTHPHVFISRSRRVNGRIEYEEPIPYHLPSKWNMTVLVKDSKCDCLANVPFLSLFYKAPTFGLQSSHSHSMDYDGDGLSDLVFTYYNQYVIIRGRDVAASEGYNINKLDQPKPEEFRRLEEGSLESLYTSLEIGDGKTKIVCLDKEKVNNAYKCIIFGDGYYHELSLKLEHTPKKLFTGDYNNDGLTDLIVLYDSEAKNGYTIFYNNGYKSWKSTLFDNDHKFTGSTMSSHNRVVQGDFNGDGLEDFAYSKSYSKSLWTAYNNGDGTFSITETEKFIVGDEKSTSDNSRYTLMAWDANHDGLSDLFYYKVLDAGTNSKWLFSTGNGFKLDKSFQKKADYSDADQGLVFLGDFDGDGYPELANYGTNLRSKSTSKNEEGINVYKYGGNLSQVGMVGSISDGMGNVTDIKYEFLTDPRVYTDSKQKKYPVSTYTLPLSVVDSIIADNGSVASRQTKVYSYSDMKIHKLGRGNLGFQSVIQKNALLRDTIQTNIVSWNKTHWIPEKVEIIHKTGSLASSESSSISINELNSTYFAYESLKEQKDPYGNVTKDSIWYDLEKGVIAGEKISYDNDMYKQMTYKYKSVSGTWLPYLYTLEQKHKDDSNVYINKTSYDYDDRLGHIVKIVKNVGNPKVELSSSFTYDQYGNLTSSVDSGYKVTPIIKRYEYNDENHRFVTKKYTLPSSRDTICLYDFWGNLLSETVKTENSEPLTTTYSYDGWGNLLSCISPDGIMTKYEKGWTDSGCKKYFTKVTTDGKSPITTWYDKAGHEVLSESFGRKGIVISKATTYRPEGWINQVVNRTGKLTLTTTYGYDNAGRVISEASSTGKIISYSYGNRTVKTTINDRSYETRTDAWGNIIESKDPYGISSPEGKDGRVSFVYYSNGQPRYISSNGSSIMLNYDEAGNKTVLMDPDAGRMLYVYAADGTLLSETNLSKTKTTYSYDELGRIAKTKIGKTIITNKYGNNGTDAMRLVCKEMDGHRIKYMYDKYGRVIEEQRSIKNHEELCFVYEYNEKGQLVKKTYPGNLTVEYSYDEYGFQDGISLNGHLISKLESYDGLQSQRSFMNELISIINRNENGYVANSTIAYSSSKIEIDKLESDYDYQTDNLMSRKRLNEQKETFAYDNLDRLIQVIRNDKNPLLMNYAPNGNILSKSDVGTYEYDKQKPHAVRRITSPVSGISSFYEKIQTSFNDLGKIETIQNEDEHLVMSFIYGPDQQRWVSTLSNNKEDSTIRTTLYGNEYEKVTENGVTREFYYIGANIIVVKQNGVFTPYLTFTDNTGSYLSIIDECGDKVYCASYDAWGNQTVSLNTIGFQRGYSGHEMIPEFGIINMNGRLYDPVVGRFLSPDNYIQEQTNSQNINRYSYCLNNPLKYTDPSGEFVITAFLCTVAYCAIVGAVAGGIIAGAYAHAMGAEVGSREFWAAVASGAISGGICGAFGPVAGWVGSHVSFYAGLSVSVSAGFAGGFLGDWAGQRIGSPYKPWNYHQSITAGSVTAATNGLQFCASKLLKMDEKYLKKEEIENKSVLELKKSTGQMHGNKQSLVNEYLRQQEFNKQFQFWWDQSWNALYSVEGMITLESMDEPSYNYYWKLPDKHPIYVNRPDGGTVINPNVNNPYNGNNVPFPYPNH